MRRHRLVLSAWLIAAAAGIASSSGAVAASADPTNGQAHPRLGVYAGPDSKGVRGAADFDHAMRQHSSDVLDFTPLNSWDQIEGQSWLLAPHAAQHARLEYSLPVVPDIAGASIEQCADGTDNPHWAKLASNLIGYGLANTIVRPGWEFNGRWYKWAAAADPATFARCFRHVVTTMRRVAGGHFRFDWNVAVGLNAFPAEQAWPGRRYVDFVGVDAYDVSWTHYSSSHDPTAANRQATLADIMSGDHGLEFWAAFAARVHRRLALPEWGVAYSTDGHGGGDDPAFITAMFDFMRTPSNHVAYSHYFDYSGGTGDHVLDGSTRFVQAAQAYRREVRATA